MEMTDGLAQVAFPAVEMAYGWTQGRVTAGKMRDGRTQVGLPAGEMGNGWKEVGGGAQKGPEKGPCRC